MQGVYASAYCCIWCVVWVGSKVPLPHNHHTHTLYPHTNTYPSPSSRWAGDSSGGATAATAAVEATAAVPATAARKAPEEGWEAKERQ